MQDIKYYQELLKKNFTIDGKIHKRYVHSLGVAEEAVRINQELKLGLNNDKVYLAGLLHDAAKLYSDSVLLDIILENDQELKKYEKELINTPQILHSFAGKYLVKRDYNIDDEEILSAIYYHTTGIDKMTLLEEVIFVADFCEERTRTGQIFDDARQSLKKGLHYATLTILKINRDYLNKQHKQLFIYGEKAYNYYERLQMNSRINEIVSSLEKAVVDDIKVYDMKEITPFYDYAIIASASSNRQAIAAIEYVRDDEEKRGKIVKPPLYDASSTWILIDLKDVIIHVFVGDERTKYNLDEMYER